MARELSWYSFPSREQEIVEKLIRDKQRAEMDNNFTLMKTIQRQIDSTCLEIQLSQMLN